MSVTLLNSDVLLDRPDRSPEMATITSSLGAARILVTGAGGSIGARLSRALAQANPEKLVLLDHHEHSLFDVARMLQTDGLAAEFALGDARNSAKLRNIVKKLEPTHVFHLAAHKHVPFGQLFPEETVSVNIQATRVLLDLCVEFDVEHFVYPSSDKAVNPPSLYGATKRIAEVATQQAALTHNRQYTIVRYVNVLGTRGSVIETFTNQLAAGESLTITDERMTRYWMTMNEAVWLLLTASEQADPADVLMLDGLVETGVVDIARRIAAELNPATDPEIRITGQRPGERLREELLSANESFAPGPIGGILRVAHRDRAAQLSVPLPDADHFESDDREALVDRVMDLATRLQ